MTVLIVPVDACPLPAPEDVKYAHAASSDGENAYDGKDGDEASSGAHARGVPHGETTVQLVMVSW